jgi:hypothetical protein
MGFLETREGRRAEARTTPEAREMMRSTDSWSVVSPAFGDRGGMVAHRGVLHPDEHVHRAVLLAEVERRLGFTLAELLGVYVQGRKSAAQRTLRGRIDARLLMLARGGGNMTLLGRIVGLHDKTFQNALARARSAAMLVFCAWHETVPPHASGTICPECAAAFA